VPRILRLLERAELRPTPLTARFPPLADHIEGSTRRWSSPTTALAPVPGWRFPAFVPRANGREVRPVVVRA